MIAAVDKKEAQDPRLALCVVCCPAVRYRGWQTQALVRLFLAFA